MSIEQRRFDGRFQYHLAVDPTLGASGVKVPNHLVQPLVENAIWHGLLPRKGRGTVRVRFMESEAGKIRIEVEDNGVGLAFHQQRQKRSAHQSMGLNILRERIDVSGKDHFFQLVETGTPHSNQTGTLAVLELEEVEV
ncbi:MAG: ATP-binding protein [Salibacteraceae bacterium]